MLNIPPKIIKPERGRYNISDFEIESYKRAKEKFDHENFERKEKNEKSSCLLSIAMTWIIAFILLSIVTSKEYNFAATFLITSLIAVIIGPFIGNIISPVSEKTVDVLSDKPTIVLTPNQQAAKAYNDAVENYNKTIKNLERSFPDIEKVNYNAEQYYKYVADEIALSIFKKNNWENARWWEGQTLNFKSCIIEVLRKLKYSNIKRTDNVRDPIDASRSKAYDISAIRGKETILVRCFNKTHGDLTILHLSELQHSLLKFENARPIFVTTIRLNKISESIKSYAHEQNIEIWDLDKLLELTKELFLNEDVITPLTLPDGFVHKIFYNISKNINDSLLTIKPCHYYILSNELFASSKDALTKISTFPKDKIYYGVCEYPRIWQYRHVQNVYGIIACFSDDGSPFRLAPECGYMFDADKRDFITNKYESSLGNRSKYMPYF